MQPILVGMNNPINKHPRYALWPRPRGSTGYRIWKMLNSRTGVSPEEYAERFVRLNIVNGYWLWADVMRAAPGKWQEVRGHGGPVVLLGQSVLRAFGLPKVQPVHWQEQRGTRWCMIPHPSGRNLWYNDPVHREVVALLLEELYYDGA